MTTPSTASARRVRQVLEELGAKVSIIELPQSARTAVAAAEAIGCTVAQIAKSLVFRGAHTGEALLAVASGR